MAKKPNSLLPESRLRLKMNDEVARPGDMRVPHVPLLGSCSSPLLGAWKQSGTRPLKLHWSVDCGVDRVKDGGKADQRTHATGANQRHQTVRPTG